MAIYASVLSHGDQNNTQTMRKIGYIVFQLFLKSIIYNTFHNLHTIKYKKYKTYISLFYASSKDDNTQESGKSLHWEQRDFLQDWIQLWGINRNKNSRKFLEGSESSSGSIWRERMNNTAITMLKKRATASAGSPHSSPLTRIHADLLLQDTEIWTCWLFALLYTPALILERKITALSPPIYHLGIQSLLSHQSMKFWLW